MLCSKCGSEMSFRYDVEERNVLFIFWDCECGERLLERKPQVQVALATSAS